MAPNPLPVRDAVATFVAVAFCVRLNEPVAKLMVPAGGGVTVRYKSLVLFAPAAFVTVRK